MIWGRIIPFLAGLALLAALTVHAGAGGVVRALSTLGFSGLAIIALLHLPIVAAMGSAWWLMGRDLPGATPRKFIWARFVRDGASEVLPFSQLGGFLLGMRALHLDGVGAIGAALSMSVDLIMEMWAKLPYFLLGLLALLVLLPGFPLAHTLVVVLATTAAVFAIPYLLRRRLRRWLEASALALVRRWPNLGSHGDARSFFDRLFVEPQRLLRGFVLHLVCWIAGAGETWVLFALMGMRVRPLESLAIDSLVSGLRTFAFLVPAAAGVQEGSYILVCALFGISPAKAIAVSLARRARDLALGVPALAIWQAMESQAHSARVEQAADGR